METKPDDFQTLYERLTSKTARTTFVTRCLELNIAVPNQFFIKTLKQLELDSPLEAIGLAELSGDEDCFKRYCDRYISTLVSAGETRKASDFAVKVGRINKAVQIEIGLTNFEQAGKIAYQNGKTDEARDLFKLAIHDHTRKGQINESVRISRERDLLDLLPQIYSQAISANLGEKNYVGASQWALEAGSENQAVSILEDAKKYGEAGELCLQLGLDERGAKNYENANRPEKAIAIYRELGLDGQAEALTRQAQEIELDTLANTGRYDKARKLADSLGLEEQSELYAALNNFLLNHA